MKRNMLNLIIIGLVLATSGCNDSNSGNGIKNSASKPTKNVLFFLGDGMGISTLTAARIYSVGEEGNLTIDTLPQTAFVHTYL